MKKQKVKNPGKVAAKKIKQAKQPKAPVKKSSGLLSTLGGLAGGFIGGPGGAAIGSKAGDLLSTITGFGDYSVDNNTIIKGQDVPSFRLTSDGVEIAHREFISDVVGSVNFNNINYEINPGLATTFPWLSQVAQNFEEYDLMGCVFEYRPSSGTAVSNTSSALGVVIYATDYNVLNPNFATKQQMESYEYSCSTVPFEKMLHPVECAPNSNVLKTMYIRTFNPPPGSDARMYDMGSFQVATQGMQTAYTVGELWVSYHVRLKKPRIAFDNNAEWAHLQENAAATGTFGGPLGSQGGVIKSSSNLIGVSLNTVNSFLLTVPGVYYVSLNMNCGNSNLAGTITLGLGSNIAVAGNVFQDNTAGAITVTTTTRAFYSTCLIVNAAGGAPTNQITINGLTAGSSIQTDIIVTEIPTAIN